MHEAERMAMLNYMPIVGPESGPVVCIYRCIKYTICLFSAFICEETLRERRRRRRRKDK